MVGCPFPPSLWSSGGMQGEGLHGAGVPACPHAEDGAGHRWYGGMPATPRCPQHPGAWRPACPHPVGGGDGAGEARQSRGHGGSPGRVRGAGLGDIPGTLPWLQPRCPGTCCSDCPEEGAVCPREQFSTSAVGLVKNKLRIPLFSVPPSPQAAGQQCPLSSPCWARLPSPSTLKLQHPGSFSTQLSQA